MAISLTPGEHAQMITLVEKTQRLIEFLTRHPPPPNADIDGWFLYLTRVKAIQRNTDNDLSFLGCLFAKQFVARAHLGAIFDVSEKAQNATGLDVDVVVPNGSRIVGEIKTTTPYKTDDFGSNQITSLRKDFAKLRAAPATHKYLFVTDERAYNILRERYAPELTGLSLVLLSCTP